MANNKTIQEIENDLQIQKLIYQSIDDLCKSIQFYNPDIKDFELSIFNGKYLKN